MSYKGKVTLIPPDILEAQQPSKTIDIMDDTVKNALDKAGFIGRMRSEVVLSSARAEQLQAVLKKRLEAVSYALDNDLEVLKKAKDDEKDIRINKIIIASADIAAQLERESTESLFRALEMISDTFEEGLAKFINNPKHSDAVKEKNIDMFTRMFETKYAAIEKRYNLSHFD